MNTHWGSLCGVVITPWKLIGLAGTLLFSLRWLVQAWASRQAGKPTLPLLFWYMSVCGSALTLAYFIFGKTDAVGVLQTLFPLLMALYNLYLELGHKPPTPPIPQAKGEIPAETIKTQ